MTTMTIVNCANITVGAVIMLISIVRAKHLTKLLPFVSGRQQRHIERYLFLHRILMVFFFCGYLLVLFGIVFQHSFISMTFVSVIFLFGAAFVFIGIDVQSRLLSEVQSTIRGILPICAKCKKIRALDGDPKDPAAWKVIENYISERADVAFTHGYCPECFEEAMKELASMNRKA